MIGVQITLVLKANCSGLICEQNYMSYKELIFFITAACVTCMWECASIVENKAIKLNCNLSYPETWIVNIGHNYGVRHEFPALCLAAEFMQFICLSFPLLMRLATVERGDGKQPCKLSLKYRERNIGSNLITDHDFSRKDTFSFQLKYSNNIPSKHFNPCIALLIYNLVNCKYIKHQFCCVFMHIVQPNDRNI